MTKTMEDRWTTLSPPQALTEPTPKDGQGGSDDTPDDDEEPD